MTALQPCQLAWYKLACHHPDMQQSKWDYAAMTSPLAMKWEGCTCFNLWQKKQIISEGADLQTCLWQRCSPFPTDPVTAMLLFLFRKREKQSPTLHTVLRSHKLKINTVQGNILFLSMVVYKFQETYCSFGCIKGFVYSPRVTCRFTGETTSKHTKILHIQMLHLWLQTGKQR